MDDIDGRVPSVARVEHNKLTHCRTGSTGTSDSARSYLFLPSYGYHLLSTLYMHMTVSVAAAVENELEDDIGLSSLSLPPESPAGRPRLLAHLPETTHSPSGLEPNAQPNAQLKSPSSPNLTWRALPTELQTRPRKLSRSNTLPRLPRTIMHRTRLSLDGLAMSPEKVANLRRWILSLVTGEFKHRWL